jgi:DNA repair exonuclease SbcCD nuclease subunit
VENETKKILNQILIQAENLQEKCNLAILGDWFQYNNPRVDLIQWSLNYFNRAANIFEHIYVIPGNHDYRMDGYALDFLKEINRNNITYITPDSKQYVYEVLDGYYAFFMPYYDNEKLKISYTDFVINNKDQIKSNKTCLFAHLYDDMSKSGSESDLITKYISNIDFNVFSNIFDKVISGHVHTKQKYVKNGMEIFYPGNFQCLGKHDVDLNKSFTIMDNQGFIKEIFTDHILYVKRSVNSLNDDIDNILSNKLYVIYLYSGMNSLVIDWLDSQYKKFTNILNIIIINSISKTFDITSQSFSDFESISVEELIEKKIVELNDAEEVSYLMKLLKAIPKNE